MPLTQLQEYALPILDWMFSTHDRDRGSGRTYVIAVAVIRKAARNPGTVIDFSDHIRTLHAEHFIRDLIAQLVDNDVQLRAHVQLTFRSLRLHLPEPIQDWHPVEQEPLLAPSEAVPARESNRVLALGSDGSRYEVAPEPPKLSVIASRGCSLRVNLKPAIKRATRYQRLLSPTNPLEELPYR